MLWRLVLLARCRCRARHEHLSIPSCIYSLIAGRLIVLVVAAGAGWIRILPATGNRILDRRQVAVALVVSSKGHIVYVCVCVCLSRCGKPIRRQSEAGRVAMPVRLWRNGADDRRRNDNRVDKRDLEQKDQCG